MCSAKTETRNRKLRVFQNLRFPGVEDGSRAASEEMFRQFTPVFSVRMSSMNLRARVGRPTGDGGAVSVWLHRLLRLQRRRATRAGGLPLALFILQPLSAGA